MVWHQIESSFKANGFATLPCEELGLSASQLERLVNESSRFFALPMSQKLSYRVTGGEMNCRGYFESETQNYDVRGLVKDQKEGYDFGLHLHGTEYDHFYGPNLVPAEIGDPAVVISDLCASGSRLTKILATILKKDETYFATHFSPPIANLRILHYPPGFETNERSVPLVEHKDPGFLTIIYANGPGLEYFDEETRVWRPIDWAKNQVHVIVGSTLERWTEGLWRAPLHRLAMVADSRISVCFFFNPSYFSKIETISGREKFQAGQFIYAESIEPSNLTAEIQARNLSRRLN